MISYNNLINMKDNHWQLPFFDILEFQKRKTKYCICIPVINEGEKIKKQLKEMLRYSNLADIIIADWGSSDGSTDKRLLKKLGVRTLLTLKSSGYQSMQLRMAFSYALKQGYEGIIQIDGNNKDGIDAIPKFISALHQNYDYVQGSRFIKEGKAVNTPLIRWIAIRLIASPLLSLGSRFWYTDVTNGFRGYSKKYLLHPQVQPFRDEFIKYELNLYLTVRANQLGLRTKEIPVLRVYPKNRVPTKISFFKGNLNFLIAIFKVTLGLYNPR